MDPTERAVDEFLGGGPRAEEWRRMRAALENRLADLLATQDSLSAGDPGKARLAKRIAEATAQVEALREEEAVSRFVEDSVRATVVLPRPFEVDDDE